MPTSVSCLVPARRARLTPVALIVSLLTALLAATGASALLMAAPAAAHDAIIGSDPAPDSELTTVPTQITLTFNNDLSTLGGQIVMTDSTGATVASGAPTVTGPTATLDLTDPLANGAYSVAWRAVSSDSHPIDGTFAFTVADPANQADTPATPEPDATTDATTDAADEPATTEETPAPIATTEPPADADDAASTSLPWTGIILGGVLGLGVGILVTIVLKRRGRKN